MSQTHLKALLKPTFPAFIAGFVFNGTVVLLDTNQILFFDYIPSEE